MRIENVSKSLPDDRDYPYIGSFDKPFPKAVDLLPDVYEVEDQGPVGSCTCNSTISALEMLKPTSYSRLFAYWQTRNVVEDRAGQEGAQLRDAIRSCYHYGVPLELMWPYAVEQVNTKPNDAAYFDATMRKVTRYERIALNQTGTTFMRPAVEIINDVKSALNEGLPVVFGARIGKMIFDLKGPWQLHEYPRVGLGPFYGNGNDWIGNHAIILVGYDDNAQRFLIQNSWGKTYGDGGFFGMPYASFCGDTFEAWVIRGFMDVLIEGPAPLPPGYKIDPEDVLQAYRNMRPAPPTDPLDPYVQWCAKNCNNLNEIYDLGIAYLQSLKT